MAIQEYRLMKPEAYKAMRKQMITGTAVSALVLLAMLGFTRLPAAYQGRIDAEATTSFLILFTLLMPISVYVVLRRDKRKINEFALVIDGHSLTFNPSLPNEAELSFLEISQIVKMPDGSYLIYHGPAHTVHTIPSEIEHPDKLEARLNEISAVQHNTRSNFFARYFKATAQSLVVVLILFLSAGNKAVVCLTGAVLVAAAGWLLHSIRTLNGTSVSISRVKLYLLLMILVIVAKAVYML